jgi:hypothetical protein
MGYAADGSRAGLLGPEIVSDYFPFSTADAVGLARAMSPLPIDFQWLASTAHGIAKNWHESFSIYWRL